jgi:exodeoxyribonuclease-3
MKIITWNCRQAYRKKAHLILNESPDIVVVPECEAIDGLQFPLDTKMPNDSFWYGDNKNKGIGVFSYSDYKIEVLPVHNPKFEYVIPLRISNADHSLIVLAIWTKANSERNYTRHIWFAIDYYSELIKEENVIIIGDFNSSSKFDKPGRESNHSNIVKKLTHLKIYSAYHHFHSLGQGEEEHPTYYHYFKFKFPFHIDFCFVSESLLKKVSDVQVGQHDDWVKTKFSDHCPLIVSIDDSR